MKNKQFKRRASGKPFCFGKKLWENSLRRELISGNPRSQSGFKWRKPDCCMDKIIAGLSAAIKAKGRDKCILPNCLSKELAEEFGIHTGDGHLGSKSCQGKYIFYDYSISSGADETDYILNYVRPLIKRLYNLEVKLCYKKSNEIALHYKSKALFTFKHALGFPNGKKDHIEIPEIILKSEYLADFLRGLFDTDGCLQFKNRNKKAPPYPRLDLTGKSRILITQVNMILIHSGFTTSLVHEARPHYKTGKICRTSRVFLYGRKNLEKWVDLIGFSNPKNIRKFEEWNKSQNKLASLRGGLNSRPRPNCHGYQGRALPLSYTGISNKLA